MKVEVFEGLYQSHRVVNTFIKAAVFIKDTGVNICTLSCIIEKHVILSEFLTLKPHLNERTLTENKYYQIKQALTKCEVNLNSSFGGVP